MLKDITKEEELLIKAIREAKENPFEIAGALWKVYKDSFKMEQRAQIFLNCQNNIELMMKQFPKKCDDITGLECVKYTECVGCPANKKNNNVKNITA